MVRWIGGPLVLALLAASAFFSLKEIAAVSALVAEFADWMLRDRPPPS